MHRELVHFLCQNYKVKKALSYPMKKCWKSHNINKLIIHAIEPRAFHEYVLFLSMINFAKSNIWMCMYCCYYQYDIRYQKYCELLLSILSHLAQWKCTSTFFFGRKMLRKWFVMKLTIRLIFFIAKNQWIKSNKIWICHSDTRAHCTPTTFKLFCAYINIYITSHNDNNWFFSLKRDTKFFVQIYESEIDRDGYR